MKWIILAFCIVCSCSKAEDTSASIAPPQISKAEAERGLKACGTYVERLCRCAQTHKDLAQQCEDKRDNREVLRLTLEAASSSTVSVQDRWRIAKNAQDRIKQCLEDENRLDLVKCPRK